MIKMRLSLIVVIRIVFGLLIFFILLVCLLLLHCHKCANNEVNSKSDVNFSSESCVNTVREYKEEIQRLNEKIAALKLELNWHKKLQKYVVSQKSMQGKESLSEQTFLNRFTPRTEYEVIPYTSFTSQYMFGEIGFLSKKPAATPIGQQAEEVIDVIDFGIKFLNLDIESKADRMAIDNFVEGITRNDLVYGTVYDLYFRSNHSPDIFKRLKLIRPYSNLQPVDQIETIETSNEWINLILPLSGRLDKFALFMERFVDVCIRKDRRIFLTIIYFGTEGQKELKQMITKIANKESYQHYKVIFQSSEFSRGKGLQVGAESWKKGNVLMFFCDVDIYFTNDFLERCRLHTGPGSKVYYPIVFSQYNPEIVYGGQSPPPLAEQMIITNDGGFWRDFGFGMTCQYRDDFFRVGGFDLSIKGWGGEDVMLYKQYLRTKMTVIRAYDRNLMHIYHAKSCIKTLSDEQFISCLQSKAVSEGSHKQLGMLAFGSTLINGKDPEWAQKLKLSLNDLSNKK
ncbi:chondroitin sulfate N-acetylgalactosaminyltransferase 1 [Hydra vulgaris]|uniref:Hexosyltransferase n=1 Tax=Hydra vulgaris TaxID=6087 RepID=A0ABM4C3M0_HYDVU